MKIKKIKNKIKKLLSNYRYKHTISVAKYARTLANIHGINPEKAYLAGLLHDVAKEFSYKEIIELTKNDPTFSKYPNVKTLHGLASAYYAKQNFQVNDEEVLDAITDHVIPKRKSPNLTMLLYVADKLEPSRKKYSNLTNTDKYRKLAESNLQKCFLALYKLNRKV
jgi:nicotinate-nucleotide adenylyltransferase